MSELALTIVAEYINVVILCLMLCLVLTKTVSVVLPIMSWCIPVYINCYLHCSLCFRIDNGRFCQEMPVSEAQDTGGDLRVGLPSL